MSIAAAKTAIAAAVTAVDGLTCYPARPRVLKPGDCFVRWGGWERADGSAFMATYSVTIVLPQSSEDAADAFAYQVADLVADALQPLLFVTAFVPTSLAVEGQTRGLFALTITGRSE